jgi:hypothetical protein
MPELVDGPDGEQIIRLTAADIADIAAALPAPPAAPAAIQPTAQPPVLLNLYDMKEVAASSARAAEASLAAAAAAGRNADEVKALGATLVRIAGEAAARAERIAKAAALDADKAEKSDASDAEKIRGAIADGFAALAEAIRGLKPVVNVTVTVPEKSIVLENRVTVEATLPAQGARVVEVSDGRGGTIKGTIK